MAKFDVYRARLDKALLLDCQADLLEDLATRFIVPLIAIADAPKPARYLNPLIVLDDETYVMVTQFCGSVAVKDLGERLATLTEQRDEINRALDTLITGF